MTPLPPDPRPPSPGPFASAATAVVVSGILLLAVWFGMKITMVSVLAIVIPGMTITTLLLFVSMAWIFLLYGRTTRRPKWLYGTAIAIAIAMLEMFALTYIAGQAQ